MDRDCFRVYVLAPASGETRDEQHFGMDDEIAAELAYAAACTAYPDDTVVLYDLLNAQISRERVMAPLGAEPVAV